MKLSQALAVVAVLSQLNVQLDDVGGNVVRMAYTDRELLTHFARIDKPSGQW
jgi:hypothetical protein